MLFKETECFEFHRSLGVSVKFALGLVRSIHSHCLGEGFLCFIGKLSREVRLTVTADIRRESDNIVIA